MRQKVYKAKTVPSCKLDKGLIFCLRNLLLAYHLDQAGSLYLEHWLHLASLVMSTVCLGMDFHKWASTRFCYLSNMHKSLLPIRVAQSVTCLATGASLIADPGAASSIPARSHTFVEIDYEIISMVILLPSAESFKDCFQLQAKVCARTLVNCLFRLAQEKSVVR